MSANLFRTFNDRGVVKAALENLIIRNLDKYGYAKADTREIADRTGFSMARTRRHLTALWAAGEVSVFEGSPALWGIRSRRIDRRETSE